MPKTISGSELVVMLRELIDGKEEILSAPPFSRVGRIWYRECRALLQSIRPDLADQFSHIPFSKDALHVEPSWKRPEDPHYQQVKEYYMNGTARCADMLAAAIKEIDENRKYTLQDQTDPRDAKGEKWYQSAAALAAAGTVIAAVFGMLGLVTSAYLNRPAVKASNPAPQASIINSGVLDLKPGQAAAVFQSKDFVFVSVDSTNSSSPRAHIITSGFAVPPLGDDFVVEFKSQKQYTVLHGEKNFTMSLDGPTYQNGEYVLHLSVTQH
jgi:hypothetical protein